jgi:DNA-binding MarR family transcriptional regulator
MQATPPRSARPRTATEKAALSAWLSVVRSYHLCESLMTRRLAEVGVRTAEHEILANLHRDPGISQQQLAQRCFSAKSHISALLKTMEEAGWVRRETPPGDARAWSLYLTDAGATMAARTLAVQAEIVRGMCDSESVAELQAVQAAMERVGQRLEAMLTGAEPGARAARGR